MLRHAQIHNVVSQMPQKSDSAIFYKRKRCTTIFLIELFPKNGGKLTRKELRLWFDHWLRNQVQLDQSIHSHYQQYKTRGLVHVQQFAWIWEKRLHSLVPTIRHLGQEWETRGAIAGFADKEQCLMKIAVTHLNIIQKQTGNRN